MNKLFVLGLISSLILVSCNNNETIDSSGVLDNTGKLSKNDKGRFDNKPFLWDYYYMPFTSPTDIFIGTVPVVNNSESKPTLRATNSCYPRGSSGTGGRNNNSQNEYEGGLIVKNPTGVYISAVYPYSSIQSGLFDKEVVNIEKNPVRMLFKFPFDFRYQMSNTIDEWEYSEALEEALRSDKYKEHVASLNEGRKEETGYAITEYKSYSDVEKAFGANVKLGSIFTSKIQLNSKKVDIQGRLLAYLVGKNFKVSMVTPKNGFFKDPANNNLRTSPYAYVRSISYGKLAFVSIESPYSYEEIKQAFEVALKYKFIDANGNYDNKTKDIFASSRITIMTIGDKSQESYYMNNAENLKEIFKTSYTKNAYGFPIFLEMNRVGDNSAYIPKNDTVNNTDSGRGGRIGSIRTYTPKL